MYTTKAMELLMEGHGQREIYRKRLSSPQGI
jgi:hypothetical protein